MNPFRVVEERSIDYVSIDLVLEAVYRDYKFIGEVNMSDVLEWAGSIYDTLCVPGMFVHKITGDGAENPNIAISNYRGEVPLGFRKLLPAGLRDYDTKEVYRTSTNTFTPFHNTRSEAPKYTNKEKVYKIKGGYIYIETETTTLEMAYEAYPIDSRGFPLIPDKGKSIEYVKDFIAEKVAFNLLAEGKITDRFYDRIEQRALWGAGAAQTELIRPDVERMEAWTWSRVRLLPKIDQHKLSFSFASNREELRLGTV